MAGAGWEQQSGFPRAAEGGLPAALLQQHDRPDAAKEGTKPPSS